VTIECLPSTSIEALLLPRIASSFLNLSRGCRIVSLTVLTDCCSHWRLTVCRCYRHVVVSLLSRIIWLLPLSFVSETVVISLFPRIKRRFRSRFCQGDCFNFPIAPNSYLISTLIVESTSIFTSRFHFYFDSSSNFNFHCRINFYFHCRFHKSLLTLSLTVH